MTTAAGLIAADAQTIESQVDLHFRPPISEQIALSADGAHVAFSRPVRSGLNVVIVSTQTGATTATIHADDARDVLHSKEQDAGKLRYLCWAPSGRLVFAPSFELLPPPPFPSPEGGSRPSPGGPIILGDIFSIGADGSDPKTILRSAELAIRLDPPFDPPQSENSPPPPPVPIKYRKAEIVGLRANTENELLVEVPGFQYSTPQRTVILQSTELLSVDVTTGKHRALSEDVPFSTYRYDREGHRRLSMQSRGEHRDVLVRSSRERNRWTPMEKAFPSLSARDLQATPANYFGRRVIPLGFGAEPEVLFVATNLHADTFEVQAANITTNTLSPVGLSGPGPDLALGESGLNASCLIFDDYTGELAGIRLAAEPRRILWRDAEIGSLERAVREKLPGKTVEVLQWSKTRSHFLLRISHGGDPGSMYVYIRAEARLREITQTAPWLHGAAVHRTDPIELPTRDGAQVTGFITLPSRPRLPKPPLIVIFSPGFPGEPHAAYDPECQVLAEMGYVVARINQRGTAGFGQKHLHGRAGLLDTLALGDAPSALDWIAKRHTFDHKRVIAMGRGYGGHLALRALQTVPDLFRCAIAIDAPVHLDRWLPEIPSAPVAYLARRTLLEQRMPDVMKGSVLASLDSLKKPVMLIVKANSGSISMWNETLRSRLASRGRTVEYVETHDDFKLGLPKARLAVYRKLEEFLAASVNDFDVRIGPVTEVKGEND